MPIGISNNGKFPSWGPGSYNLRAALTDAEALPTGDYSLWVGIQATPYRCGGDGFANGHSPGWRVVSPGRPAAVKAGKETICAPGKGVFQIAAISHKNEKIKSYILSIDKLKNVW